MDKIEEVKKITHPFCFDTGVCNPIWASKGCPKGGNDYCDLCMEEASKMCQLFHKTKENPSGYEPKPEIDIDKLPVRGSRKPTFPPDYHM